MAHIWYALGAGLAQAWSSASGRHCHGVARAGIKQVGPGIAGVRLGRGLGRRGGKNQKQRTMLPFHKGNDPTMRTVGGKKVAHPITESSPHPLPPDFKVDQSMQRSRSQNFHSTCLVSLLRHTSTLKSGARGWCSESVSGVQLFFLLPSPCSIHPHESEASAEEGSLGLGPTSRPF